KQRERDHVAVRDVADLVSEDRIGFIRRHAPEQTAAYGDERLVLARTRRERVHLIAWIDRNLGHADAGSSGVAFDRSEEPAFSFAPWLRDDLRARRALCHPLRHR